MSLELPPQARGGAEEQLAALRDYLVRLAQELDRAAGSETALAAVGNVLTKTQAKTAEDIRAHAAALKALIIKTADEITAYADGKVEEYNSLYVAQSDFGSYYQVIERDVEDTARGAIESYRYSDAIESAQNTADGAAAAAEAYHNELSGQIRRGIMEDPTTHEMHLGIAISENLEFTGETQTANGNTYYKLASGQTLGLSNTYIFWRIRMPACRQGILAGTVLAFARALGEYGATSMIAGYTPGRTATISTTVYQLWRTNDEKGAMFWVLINLAISTVVLLTVNMLEARQKKAVKA